MQPELTAKQTSAALVSRIARKEITLFFASPIAYLFLAVFAAVTLFVFFWGEAFFSRNIADVRPLFEWMPVLLIFLASTLTMRLWSEERRTGTLEYVLTQPVPLLYFVLGKFVGCLALLFIALLITLPLPITVAIIGDLDWGPVIAGYIATFFLGAAYLSVGLFVSSRSQNQIVSLIVSVAVCGAFYLLGTAVFTKLVGYEAGEWLRLFGTGSRFDEITRGVIDFRDLYYYLSLIVVFLALNTYSLEKERWAAGFAKPNHTNWQMVTALLLLNALVGNLWLGQVTSLRYDATEGKQYSISEATRRTLEQLQEPLLIRGYFSEKTHPLLSPLVPQLRDLIREYEIAGNGAVRIEFIDPAKNPEREEEANQKFGIQPVPFQVADRYQASIVSSYFNVLVQYGDQHETLGFNDLIEVKAGGETDIDVQLRNPEYDLTKIIRKALKSYQTAGNLFDTIDGKVEFVAYVSDDAKLPQQLQQFKTQVKTVVEQSKQAAGDRLTVTFVDPEANSGQLAEQIAQEFGFQPMATSLFNPESFYFYLTLEQNNQVVQIPLEDFQEESFKRNFDSALKRFASGFTKTIALVAPPQMDPRMAQMYGMPPTNTPTFNQLQQFLSAEFNVVPEDLSSGRVSGNADIVLLMAPTELNEKQLFALDQFLMQGGTVIAATSPYSAEVSRQSLSLKNYASGVEAWLAHHGMDIQNSLVMDTQSVAYPIPVMRNLGNFQVQDVRMVDYPYFIDIRSSGLNQDKVITAELPQVTMTWASPIKLDEESSQNRKVTPLIHSSEMSWLSTSQNIQPTIEGGRISVYRPTGEQQAHLLAAISEGQFTSYFAGKTSPLLENSSDDEKATEAETKTEVEKAEADEAEPAFSVSSVIERSTDSARLIVFSSNDFLTDQVLSSLNMSFGSQYLNTMQLMANTLDWSLEDSGLLGIRSRSHFNRTLPPMEKDTQMFWEYLNYLLAGLALVLIALIQSVRNKARLREFRKLITA